MAHRGSLDEGSQVFSPTGSRIPARSIWLDWMQRVLAPHQSEAGLPHPRGSNDRYEAGNGRRPLP